MKATQVRELAGRLREQHGLVTRHQLHAIGISGRVVQSRLASGEWEVVTPGVLRSSASERTPEQALLAACLGAGRPAG